MKKSNRAQYDHAAQYRKERKELQRQADERKAAMMARLAKRDAEYAEQCNVSQIIRPNGKGGHIITRGQTICGCHRPTMAMQIRKDDEW